MANLAVKYRPQTFDDLVEQSLVVQMVKSLCEQPQLDNRNFLFIGPAGTGKAQPLYSKVLTPKGFVQMGDILLGDEVFTSKGNVAHVIGIFPQGKRPIYRITLQEGTYIDVSDNHLNLCYRYNEDRKLREDFVLETLDLLELYRTSRFKLRIDIPTVSWEHRDIPIHPYLLGALIGDGSLSSGNLSFSNSESDVVEKVDALLRSDWGCYLDKIPGDNVDYSIRALDTRQYIFTYKGVEYTRPDMVLHLVSLGYPKFDGDTLIRIAQGTSTYYCKRYPELQNELSYRYNSSWNSANKFREELRKLDLCVPSRCKHIPNEYLYNSTEVRMQLLQGLFDTDGYSSGSTVDWSTSSSQLSEDFAFLVRSLGARDHIGVFKSSYRAKDGNIIECGLSYCHSFKFPNGFQYCTSNKHLSRYPRYQHDPMRNIVSIEYIGDEECQCILLDHEDHTYISDGFIPTHNTTTARIISNVLNDGVVDPIEIDAASHSGVDSMRDIVNQAQQFPVGSKYKIFIIDEVHSLSNAAWQSMLKVLEENPAKSVFLLCTTNPEKIPATILSRVQTFQLSKISLDGIFNRLKYVIECENQTGRNITYEADALNFIAKLANGGMRDALTLLDKVLAYSESITSDSVQNALNLPNYDDYFALLNAYAKKDNISIATIIDTVYNSGVNFVKWFEGFHSFVINVVKYIFLKDIQSTMIPTTYADKISKYGTKHSIICLKLANKLLSLNSALKSTQYLQEVALTYLCSVPKKV